MATFHWLDLLVIVLYFAAMVLVGAYYSKKMKDTESYAVADRSLTTKIMIGTTVATCMGANSAFGMPGLALSIGMSFLYAHVAWHIGWIALIMMSRKLRDSEAVSLPDFLFKRYGGTTKMIAAIVTLVFLINSTAAQTAAVGNIFATFDLVNLKLGIVLGGILVILYTVFGGLYAVAITDTIQAILLVGGVVIAIPIAGTIQAGGLGNILANSDPLIWDMSNLSVNEMIGWILSYMLAAGSHAAYSQRIFASKDTRTAYVGSIWSNIIGFILGAVIAMSVFAAPFIFPQMQAGMTGIGEQFIPTMIFTFFPPILKGLVISALFGLVLSTADSFLLMVGTTVINDIYKVFKPDLDPKRGLFLSRVVTTVAGLVAIALALWGGSVLTLFRTGAAAYGAGMFVPLFLGCFWKKASSKAVNVGMLSGCFITILWNLTGLATRLNIEGVIVGAGCCLVLTVALSLIFPHKDLPQAATV